MTQCLMANVEFLSQSENSRWHLQTLDGEMSILVVDSAEARLRFRMSESFVANIEFRR